MRTIISKILSLVLLLGVFTGCGKREERVDVVSRLQDVSRLELAKMTVGKVGMISDPTVSESQGFLNKASAALNYVKVGTRIGVYSYDTYLSAYIDLSELRPEDVEIDEDGATATVTLPPVRIMTDGREPQLHEEHYRVTGMRTAITPAERAHLKAQMAGEVKKEMAANDGAAKMLRKEAEAKARVWFTSLLDNWGYDATINFRD